MNHLRLAAVLTAAAFLSGLLRAEPPPLKIPSDLKPVSGYVKFLPETTAKSVVYIAIDEAYPFPSEELKDPRKFILPVAGLKDGPYRFFAVGTLDDELAVVPFTVTIGKAGGPPDKPKDPPKEPVDPPVKVGQPYLLIVRPDGPASPDFARAFGLPAWQKLREAGIQIRDEGLTKAQAVYRPPAGTTFALPFVVSLRIADDGKSYSVVKPPVPMPTEEEKVLKLQEVFR